MTKFTLSLLAATALLSGGNVFASEMATSHKPVNRLHAKSLAPKATTKFAENETIFYSCSFDFLKEGTETEPAAIELDDWDNIPEELIGEENYGFGGQGIMQAGGAVYIPFEYNEYPDSDYPWYLEGLMWTPDLYEPMQVVIDLDVKIAAGCEITSDELWVYANDYSSNFDYDSGKVNTEWSHLTLKINATGFEPESDDDSYYFTIFVDGGADIVIKNVVIKENDGTTGIESVAVEGNESEVIYYNLYGQKVVNVPQGTPVIKVSGNKASKVIF